MICENYEWDVWWSESIRKRKNIARITCERIHLLVIPLYEFHSLIVTFCCELRINLSLFEFKSFFFFFFSSHYRKNWHNNRHFICTTKNWFEWWQNCIRTCSPILCKYLYLFNIIRKKNNQHFFVVTSLLSTAVCHKLFLYSSLVFNYNFVALITSNYSLITEQNSINTRNHLTNQLNVKTRKLNNSI